MGKSLHSRQDEAQVKIFVIDDGPAAIRVLTYLLERSGYQGISTQSAKDAFFLLHETPADLIITDIFIPDINSLEVLTRLKKISRHPHPRHLWRLQYRGQEPLGTSARIRYRWYVSQTLQSRRLHRNYHRSARLNTLLVNPSSDRYTPNAQAAPFTGRPQLQCHSTRWSNPIREIWKNPSSLKRRHTL